MAYQQRARSFSFVAATGVGRVVEVVPSREETPVLARPPMGSRRTVGGTESVDVATFVRDRGSILMAAR